MMCKVIGCERALYSQGLCAGHEKRLRVHGDVQADVPLRTWRYGDERCRADGCEKKIRAKGLCGAHLERLRRNGTLGDAPVRKKGEPRGYCTVPGCDREHQGRGYCAAHLSRLNRTGDVMAGKPVRTNLGWYIDPAGYVITTTRKDHPGRAKGQRIFEHRRVMELALGRRLRKGETVHHKNGDRADNRPENLELWSRAQPAGQRVLDRLAWARQIIAEYEPEEARLREMEASDEGLHAGRRDSGQAQAQP